MPTLKRNSDEGINCRVHIRLDNVNQLQTERYHDYSSWTRIPPACKP